MKPPLVADEMFPEGPNFMELDEPGGSGLLMDLAANEKDVHADFFNGKTFLNKWEVKLTSSLSYLSFEHHDFCKYFL